MTTPTIYPCRNMNMFCKHPDSGRVAFFNFLVIFEFIPPTILASCLRMRTLCMRRSARAAILYSLAPPPMACAGGRAGVSVNANDTAFSSGESRNVKQLGEASA